MKLSFDSVNGYRVDVPGDQTGEYIEQGDCFKFLEFVGERFVRLNGTWVHRYHDQRNPDNYRSTEQLLDMYEAYKAILV